MRPDKKLDIIFHNPNPDNEQLIATLMRITAEMMVEKVEQEILHMSDDVPLSDMPMPVAPPIRTAKPKRKSYDLGR